MPEIRLWAPGAASAEAVVVPSRASRRSQSSLLSQRDSDPQSPLLSQRDSDPQTPLLNQPGGEQRVPMVKEPGTGEWLVELAAGTDYLLAIDGGEPRPDPRSAQQPSGVHGPSRVFDASAHGWRDADWPGADVLGGVFYELHVGTFTPEGTLDAAIGKLPYLKEIGVDTVELMPVVPFPGDRGWGYDGVALYAVHEAYGGPAALQRFVDAAHDLGLAVCLDVVYNHFGPAGNYAPVFGPYFTDKHHTPWGAAINLDDAGSDGVRRFVCDNAARWIRDFHLDALRLDAVHALIDDSPTHILAELAATVDAVAAETGRPATLIAESDENDIRTLTPLEAGGRGMDGQWADDVHHALHAWLTGETFGYYVDFGSPEVLGKAFTGVFVHDGGYSTFRGKNWGTPVPDDVDRRRFVVFTQNHDQVGNRGQGDRPDVRLDPGAVAGGAALLLLGPFTPMLFQGHEWGTRRPFLFFTDHDEELGRLVTAGRTKEFASHGWEEIYGPDPLVPDPQDPSTFHDSTLDWSEPDEPGHAAMLAWHRDLIRLRRTHLAGERHRVAVDHGDGWFRLEHGPLTVLVAPRGAADAIPEPRATVVAQWGEASVAGGRVRLGDHAVVVLQD